MVNPENSSLIQSIRNGCYQAEQSTANFFYELKDLRHNPDFFEKVCQVAFNAIQLAILHSPSAAYLQEFVFTLKTAQMHDFYQFLKQPFHWFFPITAESIDDNGVKRSLEEILKKQYTNVDQAIACLKEQLEDMQGCGRHPRYNQDAYRTVEEFKDVFQRRLRQISGFENVDLSGLQVPLHPVSLLERLTDYTWGLVDIGCVGLYLHAWKLLDTAKWGGMIGQYQGFQWVKDAVLENWVVGLVCTGFALKFTKAVRDLQQEGLTEEARVQALWNGFTSAAEFLFFGAIYMNQKGWSSLEQSNILWLGIFAKGFGAISIILKPKHQFLQTPVTP